MSTQNFLHAHYEKIILAVLLILFVGLLYFQLSIIQNAQHQKVDDIVNKQDPAPDFKKIDYSKEHRFQESVVFTDALQWDEWIRDTASPSDTQKDKSIKIAEDKSDMMTPIPLAVCPHCSKLVRASDFPQKGEKKEGKCQACGKTLMPRLSDRQVELNQVEVEENTDKNNNGIPDEWEMKYKLNATEDEDPDKDGFTNLEEYKAKTDPRNAASHPLYVTKIVLETEPKQDSLEELLKPVLSKYNEERPYIRVEDISAKKVEFVFRKTAVKKGSPALRKSFSLPKNGKEVNIVWRNKISGVKEEDTMTGFTLIDIKEVPGKKKQYYAIIERSSDKLVLNCYKDQQIFTDYAVITLRNTIDNKIIITKTGAKILLGDGNNSKEEYTVTSVEGTGSDTSVILTAADGKTTYAVRMLSTGTESEKSGDSNKETENNDQTKE